MSSILETSTAVPTTLKNPVSVQNPKIVYVLQNAEMDLAEDMGPPILIKYTVKTLQRAGLIADILKLHAGRTVVHLTDVDQPQSIDIVSANTISSSAAFKFIESGIRRLQGIFELPYFALFDTYRFYEACVRQLPGYTVCHEYHGLFSLGAALACLRLRVPYVITIDADVLLELAYVGKPLKGLQAAFARIGAKFTFNTASKIICVSEAARQHFIKNWRIKPEKIVVIPNGVDINRFHPNTQAPKLRQKLGVTEHTSIVMFVGGFQPWHGLEQLIEGFAAAQPHIPEAKLILVGDGPIRQQIEEKSKALGIDNSVLFCGVVPHDQIPDYLAIADVVTAPYAHLPQEMWFSPLKLYEYMAAGKAIIASAEGQISEVIQPDHTGILVKTGDTNALTEAIIKLVNSPIERERLGQNARKQTVDKHSWEQSIKSLIEVYRDVQKTFTPS